MVFSCSEQGCSGTFSNDKELKAHKKSLHSVSITCKFYSHPDLVTLVRQEDGYFKCPACGFQGQEYMVLYNHCTRTKTEVHQGQVTEYLTSIKAAPSQGLSGTQASPRHSQREDEDSSYDLAGALCKASQKVMIISVISWIRTLTTFFIILGCGIQHPSAEHLPGYRC
jgi:hypothetical protein